MAIIGNNSVGGNSNSRTNSLPHMMIDNATYTYVAAANQEVFELNFYVGSSYAGDGNGVDVGVYDITSGTGGASLVASANVALSVNQWNTTAITPVSLVEGNTYAVAVRVVSATNVKVHSDYTGSAVSSSNLTGTSALASSWTDNGNSGNVISVYAETQAAAPSTSITPTDTTPTDGSLQTITASGMTGPVTAASIGGLDILSSLSSTDPSSPITFTVDVSATEASTGMPRIGETSTISFTTATDGAVTTDVTMQPKANWTTVTLAGTLDKTANGFLDALDTDLGVTSAVGDIIYYSNARGEAITATGVYTGGTTVAYQSTEFVFQDVTGASATVAATSEGGQFYPFGETPSGGGGGVPKTKFRRFPWQSWNPL